MMFIIIFIGAYRYYAALAERFGKTKWIYGLMAIGIYIGFQMLFFLSYGIYDAFTNINAMSQNSYTGFSGINIISWLFAIAGVYGVYHLLENKFRKEAARTEVSEIDEIGIEENEDSAPLLK